MQNFTMKHEIKFLILTSFHHLAYVNCLTLIIYVYSYNFIYNYVCLVMVCLIYKLLKFQVKVKLVIFSMFKNVCLKKNSLEFFFK